ncbi:hypothetical protein OJJOAM_002689 [Cupriavidus sp. H18C1]
MSIASGSCASMRFRRRWRCASVRRQGSAAASSAPPAASENGSGSSDSAANAISRLAALKPSSCPTDQLLPDCCSQRSSAATRGTRISRRCIRGLPASIRSFRIDICSRPSWPPADSARMRASMRRAEAP